MCPLVSGISTRDAALSAELGMRALDLAVGGAALAPTRDATEGEIQSDSSNCSLEDNGVLKPGGHLIIKLLESEDNKGKDFLYGALFSFWYAFLLSYSWSCAIQNSARFANLFSESHRGCGPKLQDHLLEKYILFARVFVDFKLQKSDSPYAEGQHVSEIGRLYPMPRRRIYVSNVRAMWHAQLYQTAQLLVMLSQDVIFMFLFMRGTYETPIVFSLLIISCESCLLLVCASI